MKTKPKLTTSILLILMAAITINNGNAEEATSRDTWEAQHEDSDPTSAKRTPPLPTPSDATRRKVAIAALWGLSKRIKKHGSADPNYHVNTRVTSTAIAGLAFIASGSTSRFGPYAKSIQSCSTFILGTINQKKQKSKYDQSSWANAYAALFLSELYAKDRNAKVGLGLKALTQKILKAQTKAGGWCHGKDDVPNVLGYTDFNAVGVLSLHALGSAKKVGVPLKFDGHPKALKYVVDSSSPEGGVGYSPRPGQKGFGNAGRTAGAILAFNALGEKKHVFYPKMVAYLRRRINSIEYGHGSPLYHLLNGALVSRALGKEDWNIFWKLWGGKICSRLQADGTMKSAGQKRDGKKGSPKKRAPKPSSENGDRATATQALIMCLPENKLTHIIKFK